MDEKKRKSARQIQLAWKLHKKIKYAYPILRECYPDTYGSRKSFLISYAPRFCTIFNCKDRNEVVLPM